MDHFTTDTRSFTNDLDIPAFALVVHGDAHSYIGAVCDTWDEAAERQDDFKHFSNIEEIGPGETLDLDIWGQTACEKLHKRVVNKLLAAMV